MKHLRRLRKTQALREMVSETNLSIKNLVMPCFVIEGKNQKKPITSMPGIYQLSIDNLLVEVKELIQMGIPAILLFGIPDKKDTQGSQAYWEDGIVQRAVERIKKEVPEIVIITDVCLCSYATSGHCEVKDNDTTLKILTKIALSHAKAGADMVAPSAMMDGQVGAIRQALDKSGFNDTGIMAYSAKYASSFYGPFREAASCAPKQGDRSSYQMDFRNSDEALREIEADIEEGADIVMVKPALAYLDVIRRAKERFNIPLVAYNVSGEYSMVKAAAQNGWLDDKKIALEILTAIKRAGAGIIVTYHAKEIAEII